MSEQGQQQQQGQQGQGQQGQQQQQAALTLGADPAFATWDAETQGHFKNNGWDAKSPTEAAFEAMKSYREAQKFIGVPKDQLARIPKADAPEAEKNAFWQRLGAGAKAEDYDLKGIKHADGAELDPDLVTALRNAFHAEAIPKDKATGIAKAVVKQMDSVVSGENAEQTAKLALERDNLAKSWGGNAEANKFIVRQAVMKLGWDEKMVDGLEKQVGYEKIMQGLLKLGQQMGEDKFVASGEGPTRGIMTREQASARLQELKQDPEWVRKVNNGDTAANREFNQLTTIMS